MREQINEKLGYGLSNYYYDSLSRILSKENSWFYRTNYLSKKLEKKINLQDYVIDVYNWSLTSKENFEILSKKIGITKICYSGIIYKPEFKFNMKASD